MFRTFYWRLRWVVSRSIFILFVIRFIPSVQHTVVSRKTDLLIEGYPRSGNTFARNAFLFACNNQYVLNSHLHFIANVKRAIQLKKPVLILLRNPVDAVASYLVYCGESLPVKQALLEYVEFYSYVLKNNSQVVVASFEEVTGAFGNVLERINRRFQTTFPLFEHTEDNVKYCMEATKEQISPWRGERHRWDEVRNASMPMEGRGLLKQKVQAKLMGMQYAGLMKQAQELYGNLLDPAG